MYTTRFAEYQQPPKLIRQAAIRRVRIANHRRARSLARKLVMDPDIVYEYWFSSDAGIVMHHLASHDHVWSVPQRWLPPLEDARP